MKKTIFTLLLLLFQVAAFNFQLSTASAQNLYIGSFYVTTTDEEKLYGDGGDKWANRLPVICDMFNFEQPDVLGLQSLTESQTNSIYTRTKTSFNMVRNIMYNKNLVLVSDGVVEGMPEGSTCTWARLQKEETDFYVFNICFASGSNIPSTSATRVLTAIGEINTEKLACFIVGNTGINESGLAYSRINTRYPDCYTSSAVVSAEYGTKNNFDLAANHSSERFDFIFASKAVTVNAYGQLQYGYFTKESDGSYKRRLPSTHFPVMAKVTLH